jgi:hypothetical protein
MALRDQIEDLALTIGQLGKLGSFGTARLSRRPIVRRRNVIMRRAMAGLRSLRLLHRRDRSQQFIRDLASFNK